MRVVKSDACRIRRPVVVLTTLAESGDVPSIDTVDSNARVVKPHDVKMFSAVRDDLDHFRFDVAPRLV